MRWASSSSALSPLIARARAATLPDQSEGQVKCCGAARAGEDLIIVGIDPVCVGQNFWKQALHLPEMGRVNGAVTAIEQARLGQQETSGAQADDRDIRRIGGAQIGSDFIALFKTPWQLAADNHDVVEFSGSGNVSCGQTSTPQLAVTGSGGRDDLSSGNRSAG